jgi:hypothetical protein
MKKYLDHDLLSLLYVGAKRAGWRMFFLIRSLIFCLSVFFKERLEYSQ